MEKSAKKNVSNVDDYIALQEAFMRPKLEQLRRTIHKAAPDAEEVISYSMPAYKLHGMLIYFAAFKNHLGLYPMKSGVNTFREKLDGYLLREGTIQFTWDKPLPVKLVAEIVKFRANENLDKKKAKEVLKKKAKQ
ncbi:MAG: DUF1801 domain-containing protein [Chitinophagaceae bacterium]|nr:DUF1801 domain-containing protein [Chitinophagaceae bacterium]